MTMVDEEIYRARRRRFLRTQRIDDVNRDDLGTGGLASHLAEMTATVFVLPEDPEGVVVEADAAFDSWLETQMWVSLDGRSFQLGSATSAFAHGRLVHEHATSDESLQHYLAAHDSGVVEVGLGTRAASRWAPRVGLDERTYFSLLAMVYGCWGALEFAAALDEQVGYLGRRSLVVAITGTKGALLSGFGDGWEEPHQGFRDSGVPCRDNSARWVLELPDKADGEVRRQIACLIGDRIENLWGSTSRRHLARRGDFNGQIDPKGLRF